MKIKKQVVDCEYAIYPFGTAAPCCLKEVIAKKDTRKLKQCKMNKCEKFKFKEVSK